MNQLPDLLIKAIIGLGNPGPRFVNHRHNIGFRVVDLLCERYMGSWQSKDTMELATVRIKDNPVLLIKPQTFMNDSGKVIPFLQKKGIKAENILVVHDELEKPFGKLAMRVGGSHRGHNGLRSIIGQSGADFARLRFGIGRPEGKSQVSDYVLSNFDQDSAEIDQLVEEAADMVESQF